MGVKCWNSGPLRQGLVDFSWSCACLLTRVHHRLHSVATGWELGTHGTLMYEDAWWSSGHMLHEIVLEKILWIIWGTWESNPGPSVYQTTFPPSDPLHAFVTIMENKQYVRNSVNDIKQKKLRARFESSTHAWTPQPSSPFVPVTWMR